MDNSWVRSARRPTTTSCTKRTLQGTPGRRIGTLAASSRIAPFEAMENMVVWRMVRVLSDNGLLISQTTGRSSIQRRYLIGTLCVVARGRRVKWKALACVVELVRCSTTHPRPLTTAEANSFQNLVRNLPKMTYITYSDSHHTNRGI